MASQRRAALTGAERAAKMAGKRDSRK